MLDDLLARRDRLAADLAELDAAIAVVRRVLGGDAPAPAPEVVAPGKPEPRPAMQAPGDAGRDPPAVRVARHLAATGPQRVGQMVAAGVASQPTVNKAIRDNPTWFRRTGDGLMDPWEVTEAGRAAAT